MKRVRWFVVFALALFVLAVPTLAWAAPRATDTSCPYPGTTCTSVSPQTVTSNAPSNVLGTSATNGTGSSSLPFTGGDIAGLSAIGGGAIVVGIVLSRARRNAKARS